MHVGEHAELPAGIALLHTLRGHTGTIGQPSWSIEGDLLATPSTDQTIRVWNVTNGTISAELPGERNGATAVAFRPKGQALVRSGPSGIVLHPKSSPGVSVGITSSSCTGVAFNRQGTVLASGHRDCIRIWGVSDDGAHLAHEIATADNFISPYCFSPHGDKLASFGSDEQITLWDTANAEGYSFPANHSGGTASAVFAPHGHLMATGGAEGTVNVWDTRSHRRLATLEGHTSAVAAICFMLDNQLLVSRAVDGTIRLWNCTDWRCQTWVDLGSRSSTVISSHPTSPLLAVADSEPDP
jgi:WD40 repeat protein